MFFLHSSSTEGTPVLQSLDSYKGKDNQQCMFFLPKRDLNFMDCELNRAIRYNGKEAEYVSFKLPRKGGSWNPEFYPPAPAQEFSMTFEEWASGQNKPPILAKFDPESVNKKTDSPSRRASVFRKKVLGEIKPSEVSKF